jgi:ABC-type multidrug transport system fused ATPase/permease subunit
VLYNIKTVASFANFNFEQQRFNTCINKVHSFEKQKAIKLGISVGGMVFFINMSFVVALLYGTELIIEDQSTSNGMNCGKVLTVIFSTIMAIMSLGSIAPNIKIIQEAAIASSDYFTLVKRVSLPHIELSLSTYKPSSRDDIKGKIEFKNVSFIYPTDMHNNQRMILNKLNLVFEPGKKVALVGESGCGKSTIVNLIERLYEPIHGEILLDDVNVSKYDLNYLRSLIGYVQQEPVLFNKTIRDNIVFGRSELLNELGDENVLIKEACDDAYVSEFINNIQDTYDYVVGVKGSKLSGGQKQRIAIARAILCKPKILILDEATSALDNKSEKEVQHALDNICNKKNVTTIIIAHRLSTIKNADLIYAFKDGKVYEQGTHKELIELNGYYAGLVKSQLAQDEYDEPSEQQHITVENKKQSLTQINKDITHNVIINKELYNSNSNNGNCSLSCNVRFNKLLLLLHNDKIELFIGVISSLIVGASIPLQGYVLSSAINVLSLLNIKTIKTESLFWSMMFVVLAFTYGLFLYFKLWKFTEIGSIITSSTRKQIISKYLQLHLSYFDINANSPGALLTKLSLDTTQLNSLILSILGDIISVCGVIICGLCLGFYFSWRLTLISLCFIPFIVTSRIIVNKTRRGGRSTETKANIEAGSVLSECVTNTKTIYSFNFQNEAIKMYLNILNESSYIFIRDSILKGILMGIGVFALYANNATVFHYAWVFIKNGQLTFDNMNLAINCVMMLSNGVANNINGLTEYNKANKAFDSIYDILNTVSLINTSDEVNARKLSVTNVKGKIEFRNVSFAYPTKPGMYVLRDVSFVIQPGTSVALVGFSGSGKSTVIQLLERFYDVEEGEILIDDVNIKEYNIIELRKVIGLVSQEPVLFKRSVFDNILYGKLNASKDDVYNAAKKAAIDKVVDKCNVECNNSNSNNTVSGGEKQRIAIARVFLKNPVILLLDEATSALDKENEIEVQKSIIELQKGRTSITIAHRLSTIEHVDVIYVLEGGRIVEQGTHQELLLLKRKYSTLYKLSST